MAGRHLFRREEAQDPPLLAPPEAAPPTEDGDLRQPTANQANDYSFVAAATGSQAQWDGCPPQCDRFRSCLLTVYKDGSRVWGAPP
jgi:hypothetical protein